MSDSASEMNVSMKDNPRSIPDFASEEDARAFWATRDSADYSDQMKDVTGTPPSQLGIGPGRVGSRARKRPATGRIAAQRHLPYQTLMRSWIGERLEQEQDKSIPSFRDR